MRRDWLEKDYYAVLGLDRSATDKELKRAYRKLAQEFHPDSNQENPDAETRFKEITEAYSVLGDAEQRKEYDDVRESFSRGGFASGPRGGAQYVHFEGDLGDLLGGGMFGGLGDLFGGARGGATGRPGADLEVSLSLSFHEAISGVTKTLEVEGRRIKVKIPAGVNNGARIKIAGKGAAGLGGARPGDLFVRVTAGDHPIFSRSGKDLRVTVPISFSEATLGCDIKVPTLDGAVTLRIPPGTSSGKTFRVTGRGVGTTKGSGDLLVNVEVHVPESLTEEAEGLVRELGKHTDGNQLRSHLGV